MAPSNRRQPSVRQRPRVIVVGQLPPPDAGQFAATLDLLRRLQDSEMVEVEHLPFRFSTGSHEFGRIRLAKIIELPRIWSRILRARARGSIDLIVYPLGGPHNAPTLRDVAVLPFMLASSQRVLLHMHAGGYADAWDQLGVVRRIARWLYRRAAGTVVMTEFNRRDPVALGLDPIFVAPHQIPDVGDRHRPRGRGSDAAVAPRLVYLGMLSEEKGTRALIEAVGRVTRGGSHLQLTLVGEPFGELTTTRVREWAREAGAEGAVVLTGRLSGDEKWSALTEADLFVFPSIHPTETFGLVLVEAMMLGLPIVATRWRGNPDVLGDPFGGVWCEPGPDLTTSLTRAIESALADRDRWDAWGTANRDRFLGKYSEPANSAIVEVITRLTAPIE